MRKRTNRNLSKPLKILFISYYFPPMGMGGVIFPLKICKYLKKEGIEPIVITVKDISYYAYDYSLLSEIDFKVVRTESLDPLRIFKKSKFEEIRRFSKFSKWFIPDNKFLWLPFVIMQSLLYIRDVQAVFATSPPYTALLAALILKFLFRKKIILDFREAFCDAHFMQFPTKFHKFFCKLLEKIFINYADVIFCVNVYVKKIFERKYGKKAYILPTGFDPEDIKYEELNKKFTIFYHGSLLEKRNPKYFFDAVRDLKEFDFEVKIAGYVLPEYKKMAPKNVKFLSYLSHKESIKEMMKSHLLWLLIGKNEGKEMTTGKVYEYLASNKPILATVPDCDAKNLLKSFEGVEITEPDDKEKIKEIIKKYYHEWEKGKIRFFKRNVSEFSHPVIVRKIINFLR